MRLLYLFLFLCLLEAVVVAVDSDPTRIHAANDANDEDEDYDDEDDRSDTGDDLNTLWQRFDCDQDRILPIHSDEDWKLLQSTYRGIVGQDASSLPTGGYLGINGFYVPVQVRQGEHGRGIYAVKDIEGGTLVWRSFLTGRFESGDDYRRFLHALPPAMACDVLMWAYTRLEEQQQQQQDNNNNQGQEGGSIRDLRVVACVDLDPGSYVNGCDVEEECNMELEVAVSDTNRGRMTGCHLEFYSARNIGAGEELRIDYTFSENESGWVELGLQQGVPSLLNSLLKTTGTTIEHEEL